MLFWPSQAGPTLFSGADKVVHCLLFALLAGTALSRFGWRAPVLAAVVAYAVGSEVVQALLLPNRSGDVLDVVADVIGVALGAAVARRLLRRTLHASS